MTTLILHTSLFVFGLMTVLWAVSVFKRDVSIVDPFWSIGFLIVTLYSALNTGIGPKKLLVLACVTLWAVRLFLYLFIRHIGRPEDPRYTAFRQTFGAHRYWWVSYFQVFLLQGALIIVISAPLLVAASVAPTDPIEPSDCIATVVFFMGFAIEVVADWQLAAYRRRDPATRPVVLDSGLWRYSRHPNYFGEAILWWGFWLFAISSPVGAYTLFSPILMTYLLVAVSGVRLLDKQLRQTKPGYDAYMRRTSGFILWPPRA